MALPDLLRKLVKVLGMDSYTTKQHNVLLHILNSQSNLQTTPNPIGVTAWPRSSSLATSCCFHVGYSSWHSFAAEALYN
jgi:hypothetical protein